MSFNESLEVQVQQMPYMKSLFISPKKDPDLAKKDVEGSELTPKVPQFDAVKTMTIMLQDGHLVNSAAQMFPDVDLTKAIKNPDMLGPVELEKLQFVYNEIILKDYTLRQKYDLLPDSVDKNLCPECSEKYTSQCKCRTTGSKTLEDLKRGHGKRCPNGHVWSYDTPDGKAITLLK